jgi:methionyl-tRNA synthetase
MIVSQFSLDELSEAFGIGMSPVPGLGPGCSWGRVVPGGRTRPDRHDENEILVFVRGTGQVVVDSRRVDVSPGTVLLLEPFDTHVIENTGAQDFVFFSLYWRDPARTVRAAAGHRQRFDERPVFVFSTPPTPNGDLHLGHLSGPYLGADVYVRFQRMNGVAAWHLTGSDDYQSYVVECAAREGREPAQTAAHYSAEIAATLDLMDIPLDQYTVTSTDSTYEKGLQAFFSALVASGAVVPRPAPALFDSGTGRYVYEVDVSGGCPGCGASTGGNICEDCGEPNVCVDLVDPRTRSGEPRQADATRYLLALHEFRDVVADHHRMSRVPARLRELAERVFARERLDLPVSHLSDWGVRPAEPGADGQVIWVWPEMAYGFLHGIEQLGRRLGRSWDANDPDPDWKIVHFFGYDNSFYHSLLYPVLYALAYPDWKPDIDYHVNEFYLLAGEKFSTSRRHAIWGKEILSPQTVDAVRFHLAATRPEGRRTNFDLVAYEATVRDVLVGSWQRWLNDLGTRVAQRYGGHAPDAGTWTPEHTAFLRRLGDRLSALTGHLGQDGFRLNPATAELTGIVEDVRRFAAAEYLVSDADLWTSETRTALALELAAARLLATCATPIMPRFAGNLLTRLGLPRQAVWPGLVELVPAGTAVDLVDAEFFQAHPQPVAVAG